MPGISGIEGLQHCDAIRSHRRQQVRIVNSLAPQAVSDHQIQPQTQNLGRLQPNEKNGCG
jgi:hypothetical protein